MARFTPAEQHVYSKEYPLIPRTPAEYYIGDLSFSMVVII